MKIKLAVFAVLAFLTYHTVKLIPVSDDGERTQYDVAVELPSDVEEFAYDTVEQTAETLNEATDIIADWAEKKAKENAAEGHEDARRTHEESQTRNLPEGEGALVAVFIKGYETKTGSWVPGYWTYTSKQ